MGTIFFIVFTGQEYNNQGGYNEVTEQVCYQYGYFTDMQEVEAFVTALNTDPETSGEYYWGALENHDSIIKELQEKDTTEITNTNQTKH